MRRILQLIGAIDPETVQAVLLLVGFAGFVCLLFLLVLFPALFPPRVQAAVVWVSALAMCVGIATMVFIIAAG